MKKLEWLWSITEYNWHIIYMYNCIPFSIAIWKSYSDIPKTCEKWNTIR